MVTNPHIGGGRSLDYPDVFFKPKKYTMLNRVNNDVNGNPRYVCHFLSLLNQEEQERASKMAETSNKWAVDIMYQMALKKSRKIGGRKFSNKSYGGGIAFQSYNVNDLSRMINELREESIIL
jgi:hypothetical protein